MINEDYVSRETYKLLREKGFDGEIHTTFDKEGHTQQSITLQMAMKWLREVHKIHILINYTFRADANITKDYVSYCYQAENANTFISYTDNIWYETGEKACEAAIKYCLENLI